MPNRHLCLRLSPVSELWVQDGEQTVRDVNGLSQLMQLDPESTQRLISDHPGCDPPSCGMVLHRVLHGGEVYLLGHEQLSCNDAGSPEVFPVTAVQATPFNAFHC